MLGWVGTYMPLYRTTIAALLARLLFSGQAVPPVKQTDASVQSDDVRKVQAEREARFLEILKIVNEPSLLERSKDKSAQSYRFIWLFSSNHPICVRVDVLGDGSGLLTAKFYRKPRPDSGFERQDSTVPVSKEEVTSFVASVHKLGLWSLPYEERLPKGVYVMDGVNYIFEEASQGTYHVITRLSPRTGPLVELSKSMLRWAQIKQ